ncbi:MAG: hypothetical protein U0514_01590 [Candidatus Andersenbacteria bacterium]
MASDQKLTTAYQLLRDAEEKVATARRLLESVGDVSDTGLERPRRSFSLEGREATNVVEGVFDGASMIGADKKIYPVPANYASKSKLVEGDTLKLTVVDDGSFIYKQIGPVERKHVRGELAKNTRGEYYVEVEGREYKVLLASVTYFKGVQGDECTLVVPASGEATWGAIENIIKTTDERELPEVVRRSLARVRGDVAEPDTSSYDKADDKSIPVATTDGE